ncbi:hypothetical protein EVAR_38499_1 [Eumeta japonica]|uniref:Uncharacterized protein n=1 Tax=Eumeta variegata TaxID=151549 RepID=A0A4C1WED5_EUMVA|nr:hypothetical protein EVAR_38499_1 [Eumeta japonica]
MMPSEVFVKKTRLEVGVSTDSEIATKATLGSTRKVNTPSSVHYAIRLLYLRQRITIGEAELRFTPAHSDIRNPEELIVRCRPLEGE